MERKELKQGGSRDSKISAEVSSDVTAHFRIHPVCWGSYCPNDQGLAKIALQVELHDVKMRYRPGLPLVLRGLTVRVEPESRVGVVGRTGAGKSSLINCLFRLMELDSGKISIDSQDISKMGLHQLRSAMSLIPQVGIFVILLIHESS